MLCPVLFFIWDSEENRNNPDVFITATPIIIPPGNNHGKKKLSFAALTYFRNMN